MSELFQVDIHPAVPIGRGAFFDHGTGIVIGETTVIGDDVSMLQNVTLGGTGAGRGDRHPKIGNGVLLGAGAKVLGNIQIGDYAKIASGSVVLKPVPPHCTAAGVPARLVKCRPAPSRRKSWIRPWPRTSTTTSSDQHLKSPRGAPARGGGSPSPIQALGTAPATLAELRSPAVNDKDIKRIEAHLRRTFANGQITLKPRPKQKDSCELYIGEEFVGVVYQDEDEDGSFLFEMAILAEDLD